MQRKNSPTPTHRPKGSKGPPSKERQIVVWRFVSKFPVIARPVRRLVVAIPRLEGKCTEKHPQGWELPRFLVVIVTWFLSTGGVPRHLSALARNDSVYSPNTNLPLCIPDRQTSFPKYAAKPGAAIGPCRVHSIVRGSFPIRRRGSCPPGWYPIPISRPHNRRCPDTSR